MFVFFFFFKQKTAYEMRISDWSSDVCSSDLARIGLLVADDQPLGLERCDCGPRQPVVFTIEHPDLPRALLIGITCELRREAVQRQDHRRRRCREHRRDTVVLGTKEASQPPIAPRLVGRLLRARVALSVTRATAPRPVAPVARDYRQLSPRQ